MLGKTNVGGSKKAFAIIGVTYPAGSVCTCTDGTKTLTLKDTSGLGIFLIPYAATWTVSCTDGTKTASKVVSIITEGQGEIVTLMYYLAVLENGVLSTLTGGIDGLNSQTSFTKGKIVSVRKNSDGNYFTTKNAINVTDYSTLYIHITYDSKTDFLDHYYGLTKNKIANGAFGDEIGKFKYYKFVKKGDIVEGSTVEITVNISSATGNYYIAACTQDAWKIDTIRLLP